MNHVSFTCNGHKNITAKHKTTIEFTSNTSLTIKGDCIIGVNSSLSLKDLPDEIKKKIQKDTSKITINLEAEGMVDKIQGYGHHNLELSDNEAIIIRKSSFICPKTLVIRADKSACDINRELVDFLRNPKAKLEISFTVEEQ